MAILDTKRLSGRTLSVLGLVKNAGKTTVFNAVLDKIYAEGHLPCIAVTSIGRDGESTDVVTGTDKPGIFIRENTLVATAVELLKLGDFSLEILASAGVFTPMGEVYIVRARSGGSVQLGGPSMVEQLLRLKDEFFTLGADAVLIDGAAGRRSLGAARLADDAILCSGAALDRSMERAAEETAYVAELMTLPLYEAGEEAEILSGAVTDGTAVELLKRGRALAGKTFAADDASKLLLGAENYRKLQRLGARLVLRQKPNLLAIALNPAAPGGWRFSSTEFCRAVQARTEIPVVDVMEDSL